MNPYQRQNDWFGLYRGNTSRDDALFPRIRSPRKNGAGSLFDLEGSGARDSVAHPAKMSLPLLRKIVETMREFGWLADGACVIDPFGGRGSTAAVWCALHPENRAVTVEIEAHFIEMQQQVKAHAESRYGRPFHWAILQGDSRHVDDLLGEMTGASICSPPYGEALHPGSGTGFNGKWADPNRVGRCINGQANPSDYGHTEGQIGALPDPVCISSPPYGQGTIGRRNRASGGVDKLRELTNDPASSLFGRNPEGAWFTAAETGYGETPGNIDLCPDAAVGSPPYEASLNSDDPDKRGGLFRDPKRRNDKTLTGQYEASICSPPFEGSLADEARPNKETPEYQARYGHLTGLGDRSYASVSSPPFEAQTGGVSAPRGMDQAVVERHAAAKASKHAGYGENGSSQIGTMQNETYTDACGAVYAAMARAGIRYVALVVKNPTRGGKLRRLDKLTCRLLRAAGYWVVGWRRAWLFHTEAQVEALAGQGTLLDGGESKRKRGRISFFRRLHLAKGGAAAAWEDIFLAELTPPKEGASNWDVVVSDEAGDDDTMKICRTCGGPISGKRQIAFCSRECQDSRPSSDIAERFLGKVEQAEDPRGCWEWRGNRNRDGYGSYGVTESVSFLAHRFAFELFVGEIAPGRYVLHTCDNPGCVNPDHLFVGTQTDNVRDCKAKGRLGPRPGQRKLQESAVREIHARFGAGESLKSLATAYGVTPECIGHVVRGKTWKFIFAELPKGRGASRCSPPYEDQFPSGGGFIAPHDTTGLMAHTYAGSPDAIG